MNAVDHKRKKVMMVINNLGVGGAERLVINSIHEMMRLGIGVDLVTLALEPEKTLATQLQLPLERRYQIQFKGLFDIKSLFRLIVLLKSMNPDLVITQLWFANTVGRIAAQIAGVKKVVSYEQNVYDSVKTKKMFLLDWLLQFFTFKIVAVSEAVKKSLIRHHITASKIDVIHNSVDVSLFANAIPDPSIRRQYGVPDEAFLLLFVGRLIHQKAVDVLIEAFANIGNDAYLLVVGQGRDRFSLEAQVVKKGLGRRVMFAGVRNDIPQLLATADCFVLPSRHEGLPLVLTEALAAGKPIIVSDFDAATEMIIHGKNGLIVPREDAQKLSEAMKRIKNDRVLRSQLALEAKKSAEDFSITHHLNVLLKYL